ncbi:MAG: hypothetical protein ACXWJ0_02470 [Xanthobacteraceae bacterium]
MRFVYAVVFLAGIAAIFADHITSPFEWWPLARAPKRRADQVILILGVGF